MKTPITKLFVGLLGFVAWVAVGSALVNHGYSGAASVFTLLFLGSVFCFITNPKQSEAAKELCNV